MSEAEESTEVEVEFEAAAEPEIGHFQFTIKSLMILTAAVAVFFALLTQMDLVYAVGFVHLALFILSLRYRTRWKGIMAINWSILNFYVLPVFLDNSITELKDVIATLKLVAFGSLFFGIVLITRNDKFDSISGIICVVMYCLLIVMFPLLVPFMEM